MAEDRNLAATVLSVPNSLDSGWGLGCGVEVLGIKHRSQRRFREPLLAPHAPSPHDTFMKDRAVQFNCFLPRGVLGGEGLAWSVSRGFVQCGQV